jgi:MerR family transcriptional regulator/heat shock protein HspR
VKFEIRTLFPPGADEDTPVFVISVAAQLSGLHAQTLRSYDRLGLVSPGRASGGGRRYSARNIAVLREVQRLSQEEGVNLAGIKRIIDLENEVEQAAAAVHASYRRDLVPVRQQTALVVWKPQGRK